MKSPSRGRGANARRRPGPSKLVKLQERLAELEQLVALHPIGRIGTPDEIANAVLWLCSDDASFVLGHALSVDGGYVVP